jgi:protein TonB
MRRSCVPFAIVAWAALGGCTSAEPTVRGPVVEVQIAPIASITPSTPPAPPAPLDRFREQPVEHPPMTGLEEGVNAGSSADDGNGVVVANPALRADGSVFYPYVLGMARPSRIAGRDPSYSQAAKAAAIEGIALVKCFIEIDGRVTECRIVKGLPPMDAEILAAVSTWRMTPVIYNGKPVAVSYTFAVRIRRD